MAQPPNSDIHAVPALEPPPGLSSNLVDPYSTSSHLNVTYAICLPIVVISVAVRTLTKAYGLREIRIEDYALIYAGFSFAVLGALEVTAGRYGQGRHQWNVSIADLQQMVSYINISQIFFGPTMFCAKFSVFRQMERFFCGTIKNVVYWWIQILIWANLLAYIGIFFASTFACVPRRKLWDPSVPGRCISTNADVIVTSVLNIVSDWSALILPNLAIWKLQMAVKRKFSIAALFAVGFVACVTSIVRLYYSVRLLQTDDRTWAFEPVAMWVLVEFATVILTGAFPIVPQFVKLIRQGRKMPSSAPSDSYYRRARNLRRAPPSDLEMLSVTTPWRLNSTDNVSGSEESQLHRDIPTDSKPVPVRRRSIMSDTTKTGSSS